MVLVDPTERSQAAASQYHPVVVEALNLAKN